MPRDPKRPGSARQILLNWARGHMRKRGTPADYALIGKCPTCGVFRRRYETAQAETDEMCVYICSVCGDVIDTSLSP